jgi:hypothetical protein
VAFTDAIGRLCVRVANRDTPPRWKAESFFRRFARAVEITDGRP